MQRDRDRNKMKSMIVQLSWFSGEVENYGFNENELAEIKETIENTTDVLMRYLVIHYPENHVF
jgi:hypothetical protein